MSELKRILIAVTRQLYINALLCSLLLALSTFILLATFVEPNSWLLLAGLAGFLIGAYFTKLYRDKTPQAVRLIHQLVGNAEYSLPLLTKPNLTVAEQLQLDRLNRQIQHLRIPIVIWSNLEIYGLVLVAALGLYSTYPLLSLKKTPNHSPEKGSLVGLAHKQVDKAPAFESATLRIQPPTYTQLPTINTSNLNASSIEGSMLTWHVAFSDSRRLSVRLVRSRGQELSFRHTGTAFTFQERLINSGLYAIKAYWRINAKRDSVVYQSDFFRLEAQPDLAPKIEPVSKELYTFHHLSDPKLLNINAKISDDFSIYRTFIVATVAQGSGENVKFREVKIPLNPSHFKAATLTKTLDLNALKFAPGDELYYYWTAFDNRQPEPNFTKSDTYFVVYKDTTKADESELATMAVNVMPDYFRSQRQIIIDTEKLIAAHKKTAAKEFKSQSNEIGFDQKALRLRYGQFLGEEFEKSIGGGGSPVPTNNEGVVVAGMAAIQAYMHKHDEGEGNGAATTVPPVTHSADDGKDPLAALMEQYVHSHDNAETNTFYEQSTRALLKMALEQMWQSELHLRLYEPEQALPFERKALEYLKLSQQKARSYVKKTGFDPPIIKEKETRLTGDLTQVTTRFNIERTYKQPRVEPLAAAVLGYMDLPQLSAFQRNKVQQLGSILAERLLTSGLVDWWVLARLQKLVSGKTLSPLEKTQLKTKLYTLADPIERTRPAYVSDRALERAFWKHLK